MVYSKILRPRKEWCNDETLKRRREWLAEAAKELSSFARTARRLPSIRTRRSERRSGRSHREVALFYKPRREWMLAAIRPRREGKVGELRSLRNWPAGHGAYMLSLSAHCLAQ